MSNNKKIKQDVEIRMAKKAAVLNKSRKFKTSWLVLCGAAALLAVAGALYASGVFVKGDPPSRAFATADSQGTQVAYAISLYDDGVARHYQYEAGPNTIRYFILKSSDGVIRAAFDACDVCWPAGKGYVQQGDQMICRNCGRRFDSVRINEVKGGCNPAPLKRSVDGDRVIIRTADILEGLSYFDFSKKVTS